MKFPVIFNIFILGLLSMALGTSTFAQSSIPMQVSPFNAIKASAGVDVYLSMGTSESVRVEGSERDLKDLVVETKGETLHIYYKSRSDWSIFQGSMRRSAKVYVQAVELQEVSASSGADIRSENTIRGEVLAVSASSGADIRLDIQVGDLSLESSSGSDIYLSGRALSVNAVASSGSDIKADKLSATVAMLTVSSGADIRMEVLQELKARASSGGDIKVSGNPGERDVEKSSGGSVAFR